MFLRRDQESLPNKVTASENRNTKVSCFWHWISYGHFFFIVRNFSFFMRIIFCSSVILVWTFNTWSVYNFITKKANIPVNLVLFFSDVSFAFSRFLKSGVTNELKSLLLLKSKKARVIYSKQDKRYETVKRWFGQRKYGEPLQLHLFFKKESNIWAK